jgi:DNA-binding NtrC family response regulator
MAKQLTMMAAAVAAADAPEIDAPACADKPARISVLSVSPMEEDHALLEDFLNHSETDSRWTLYTAKTVMSTVSFLRKNPIPVVVCERDLSPGTWRELLEQFASLPEAPYLIVTSLFADDRLWAEALNLGAYDVLAKPFDKEEVVRIVSYACMRWQHQHTAHTEP